MTGLIDLNDEIKKIYDSDSGDIPRVLNLILKNSRRYNRIGSYFSSKSFISLAEGLSGFFIRNGKMKLIINYELRKEDYDELKKIIDYKKIEDRISFDIKNLKSEIELNSAKVLAWLIDNEKLEIRVVVGCQDNLMHIKQGVLEDEFGNKIAFTGSANETYNAYERNIEQVTFFKNWEKGQEDYVDEFLFKFTRFWNDCGADARTYTLAKAFEKELLRIKPKSKEELDKSLKIISNSYEESKKKNPLKPRPYQAKALDSWIKNGKRGIIEMPTGCGKTKTAIFCYREVQKEGPSITLVFAPTKAICNQWLEEFENESSCSVCKIYDNPKWKSMLKKEIIDLRLKTMDNLVIIGSYALMNSEYLIDQIKSIRNINRFLIADEAHSTGAIKTSRGLIEEYNYRLALSATPKRYLDEEGTDKIFSYFNDVVFSEISLYEAIYTLEVLSEYDYYLIHVTLNDEELERYSRITKLIIGKMAMKNKDPYNQGLDAEIQRLAEKRSKIIKNCAAKIDELEKIINQIKEERSIIFVSPEQREKVIGIVGDKIRYHQYTYSEDSETRSNAIENFKKGAIKCLIAIKCLDEGLDVPAATAGVLMASSGNPREFIQRRGRLLRKHPGKKYAKIFDFFVTPSKEAVESSEMYKSQLSKELSRIMEFAKSARNELQLSKQLKELKTNLGI